MDVLKAKKQVSKYLESANCYRFNVCYEMCGIFTFFLQSIGAFRAFRVIFEVLLFYFHLSMYVFIDLCIEYSNAHQKVKIAVSLSLLFASNVSRCSSANLLLCSPWRARPTSPT